MSIEERMTELKGKNRRLSVALIVAVSAAAISFGLALDAEFTALLIVILVLPMAILVGLWRMFVKAGQPGWGVLVPVYNLLLLTRIAGFSAWWLLLLLVPIVNVVAFLILYRCIVHNFGKGLPYVVATFILPFIFIPLLGFLGAEYAPESVGSLLPQGRKDEPSHGAPTGESQSGTPKLTTCPDCGREVSRRAASCPGCGAPLSAE